MDEQQEFRRRRQAIRWWLKGVKAKRILEQVERSRFWLSKWQTRFTNGAAGLHSHSRCPQRRAPAHTDRAVIVQTRRRLVSRPVG
jgi:hypothetical protein